MMVEIYIGWCIDAVMLYPISMHHHHEATLHHDVHVCYSALGLIASKKKEKKKKKVRSLTLLFPEKV
jgi:hypothetical protein